MGDFDAANFLSGDITGTEVEKLKKKELILVAKELDAELLVEGKAKAEVKEVLLQALTEKKLLKGTMRTRGLESDLELQLEIKRLKPEERREQREEAERHRQSERESGKRSRKVKRRKRKIFRAEKLAKEREFKLREMERKAQLSEQEGKILKKDQNARSMSLVTKFDGREVEPYFLMFEKVAKSMEWPTDMYCLFLQSVLTGKAKGVYCALSAAECANYGLVKERTLQVY